MPEAATQPRSVVIHPAINRPNQLLGGDRELVLSAVLIAATLGLSFPQLSTPGILRDLDALPIEYPILGTQMLYFFDPIFKMRSEIHPPEKFPSLQKKLPSPTLPAAVEPKAAAEKPPQRVQSRPEQSMPEISDDEQAFLAQLDLWDAEEESEDEPEHAEESY